MEKYKSYEYVKEILNMPFEDGWKAYKKGIERIRQDNEDKLKEKYWDLWKIESQNGNFKGTFEEYYKSKTAKNENTYSENVQEEEKRIFEKCKNL